MLNVKNDHRRHTKYKRVFQIFIQSNGLYGKQVRHLSEIRHRNLVSLLGYCQENGSQMLVFEYLPNGSISNHLYGMTRFMALISDDHGRIRHAISDSHHLWQLLE